MKSTENAIKYTNAPYEANASERIVIGIGSSVTSSSESSSISIVLSNGSSSKIKNENAKNELDSSTNQIHRNYLHNSFFNDSSEDKVSNCEEKVIPLYTTARENYNGYYTNSNISKIEFNREYRTATEEKLQSRIKFYNKSIEEVKFKSKQKKIMVKIKNQRKQYRQAQPKKINKSCCSAISAFFKSKKKVKEFKPTVESIQMNKPVY